MRSSRTVTALPWDNPAFAGAGYGMLLFILGGFGGMINASYSMDALVHNTVWIVGHFHVTVGGPVALTFMGAAYWLMPRLTGRRLWAPSWALWQTRLWFSGMLVMSLSMHAAGLLGAPRRTASVSYAGSSIAAGWEPYMLLAAAGGAILFFSVLMFAAVAIGTLRMDDKSESLRVEFAQASELSGKTPMVLQTIWRWGAVALVLAVLAYAGPVADLIQHPGFLAPGMRTW